MRASVLIGAAFVLLGCGGGSPKSAEGGTDPDTGAGAGEVRPDAAPGADGPAAESAGSDAAADVPAEAARDAATGADAPAEAGRDTSAGADGSTSDASISCGTMTCTGDDLCVTVNTCGGAAVCTALPDGGTCPAGMIQGFCPGTARPGCVTACPPPTYSCRPRPAECGAAINCMCARSVCSGGPSCATASNRSVYCAYF